MRLPEDVFDEAFQRCSPQEQNRYKGRDDLSKLPPPVRDQLRLIQNTFTEALRNERRDVPEHLDHPPFHVDYVDSSIPNALAFRSEGYSFIGITIPLIYSASDVCLRLSKSRTIATAMGVQTSAEDYNALHAVLFSILVSFIIAHEYTHHVYGHVNLSSAEAPFYNEILDTGYLSDLGTQIQEVVADGYAIYHVLANFLDGQGRSWLPVLKLDAVQTRIQDEVLLSLVVVAVGAYLFLRPPSTSSIADIYKGSHPPQVVRMDCIMQEAMNWCHQNRPELEQFMTPGRFQQLMNSVVETTQGVNAVQAYGDQAALFRSEEGVNYTRALWSGVNAYKQAL
jgi:hypothetical protein